MRLQYVTAFLMGPLLGLGLSACTTQDRIGHNETRTDDHVVAAPTTSDNMKGDQVTSERVPVAGSDLPLLKPLKDKLGDDWSVSSTNGKTLLVTRVKVKSTDDKMSAKVSDQIRSMKSDHPGLSAMRSGETVSLSGVVPNCDDVTGVVNDYAKIDGVNRITIDVNCNLK